MTTAEKYLSSLNEFGKITERRRGARRKKWAQQQKQGVQNAQREKESEEERAREFDYWINQEKERERAEQVANARARVNNNPSSSSPASPQGPHSKWPLNMPPEVDMTQTTYGQKKAALAKKVRGVPGKAAGVYTGIRAGQKDRKILAKDIISKKAKRSKLKLGLGRQKIPKYVLKEIEDLKKSHPDYALDIQLYAKKKEDELARWRLWQERDIKSGERAAKSGYRSGKWTARRRGAAAATRELAGAIPRAFNQYRATASAEKRASRDQRDYTKSMLQGRTTAIKRDLDQFHNNYLVTIKDWARRGHFRTNNDAALHHEIEQLKNEEFPSIVPEMGLDELMERARVVRSRKRYRGGLNPDENPAQTGSSSHTAKAAAKKLKQLTDPAEMFKAKPGGRRKKKRKVARAKRGDFGMAFGQDPWGDVPKPGDLAKDMVGKPGKPYVPKVDKLKPRPHHKSPIALERQRGVELQRRLSGKSEGVHGYFTSKMEAAGQQPHHRPTIVKQNAAQQSMRDDERATDRAELKAKAQRAIARSQGVSRKGQTGPSAISQAGHSAKSAAGKVARATGADELASVPRSVHQNIKHHAIHKFLLR